MVSSDCLWFGFLHRGFGMVSVVSGSEVCVELFINGAITGKSAKIPAVDLAKLWVLADRCLMPQLQNHDMKKLGSPDAWPEHITKAPNLVQDRGTGVAAHTKLIAYANTTEGIETPLKRYCIRLLLSRIDGDEGEGLPLRQDRVLSILGPGMMADVIKALMAMGLYLIFQLPVWRLSDYLVEENI